MTTTAPWLDAEPIICPWCEGPCTEPPDTSDQDDPENPDLGFSQ